MKLFTSILITFLAYTALANPNLLQNAKIVECIQVTHPNRLTDGILSQPGDYYLTEGSSWFKKQTSHVTWDLGTNITIQYFYVQADNNDDYLVEGSLDDHSYQTLWKVPEVPEGGMQARNKQIIANVRYIRLSSSGGDGAYGIGEFIASSQASNAAPSLQVQHFPNLTTSILNRFLTFLAACLVSMLIMRHPRCYLLSCLATILLALRWWSLQIEILPPSPAMQSLIRFSAALIALASICCLKQTNKDQFKILIVPLSLATILALLGFSNFYQPQFQDARTNQSRYIHDADMHVYYPVAKYYKELGYDGIYLASALAYMDNTGQTPDGKVIRNLLTDNMDPIAGSLLEMDKVQHRFSPERWQDFTHDMNYFRKTMGNEGYLDGLTDHGGNATPFWFLITHTLFTSTHAGDKVLFLASTLDPLLLIILAIVIARSFGTLTMLTCATIFGATDIYMFGTTWAGATLRYDWIVYLGLGLCALHTKRWITGGIFLGLSTLIRAFPALTILALTFPAIYTTAEYIIQQRKFPQMKPWWLANTAYLTPILAALTTTLIGVGITSITFGFHAWQTWYSKVQLLDNGGCVNGESLRMWLAFDPGAGFRGLLGFDSSLDWSHFNDRWNSFHLLRLGVDALAIGWLIANSKHKTPHQAALIGFLLLPLVFNPANYYLHAFFLLALLFPLSSSIGRKTCALLLLLCIFQYRTTFIPDQGMHFLSATTLLLGTFGLIALLLKYETKEV